MLAIKVKLYFYLAYIMKDIGLSKAANKLSNHAFRLAMGSPAHSMGAYAEQIKKRSQDLGRK